MSETQIEVFTECDPTTGFHVVLPEAERCQCGERARMNSPQPDLPAPSNIIGCARCGGEHLVRFKPFRIPMQVGEATLTHWGLCPVTKEPILMRFATPPADDVQISALPSPVLVPELPPPHSA